MDVGLLAGILLYMLVFVEYCLEVVCSAKQVGKAVHH